MFADSLGVSDIRIISAAQYNEMLGVVRMIPEDVYKKYPILRYRIENVLNGVGVRGINENDVRRCYIALDDMVVAGDYHFPCVIYMREGGNPIGKVGLDMRKERVEWVEKHDSYSDEICRKNCLDCIVKYNNRYEEVRR